MADLLDRGLAWLKAKREAHMAGPVIYSQGDTQLPVVASIGQGFFRLQDESGASFVMKTRDFIIGSDALTVTPKPGDTIEHNGATYEVVSPGGEPSWRWCDPYHRSYRIHTQQVSA